MSTITGVKDFTVIIGPGYYSSPLINNGSITPPYLEGNNSDTVGASGIYSDLAGGASLTNNGIVDGATGTYEGYQSGGTGGIGVYFRTAGSSVTNNEGHIYGGTGGGSYYSGGTGGV